MCNYGVFIVFLDIFMYLNNFVLLYLQLFGVEIGLLIYSFWIFGGIIGGLIDRFVIEIKCVFYFVFWGLIFFIGVLVVVFVGMMFIVEVLVSGFVWIVVGLDIFVDIIVGFFIVWIVLVCFCDVYGYG